MKRLVFILTVISVLSAQAQYDTSSVRQQSLWAPAAGTVLLTTGSLFTFNPYLKSQAVSLRDAVQADGHPRLRFDDYLQYAPGAAPVMLNLCGVKGRHDFKKLVLLEGGSYLLGVAFLEVGKYGIRVERPDGANTTSFPSGHTFTAFTGAEVLRREYGEEYPWIAVAGYAVATFIGAMRIYNNRHWAGDVLAGAGLGILSASAVYWLFD